MQLNPFEHWCVGKIGNGWTAAGILVGWLLLLPAAGSFAQSDDRLQWRLTLKDGGFAAGRLVASEQSGRVRWWIPGFDQPFDLDIDAIRSIAAIGDRGEPGAAAHSVELADGSVVHGRLVAMDEQTLELESPSLGRVRLRRDACRRLSDSTYTGQVVYTGPLDSERWSSRSRIEDWEFRAGELRATRQGAVAVGRVGLPAKSQIEFALRWRGVPNFVFSFGTSTENVRPPAGQIPAAVRLEVWDKELALVREVGRRADIEMLSGLSPGTSRIALTMFLDQEQGTAAVYDSLGRLLGAVSVQPDDPRPRSAVHLANNGPGLTLEHFEVRQWDGLTQPVATDANTTLLVDGTKLEARIADFDAERQRVRLAPRESQEPVEVAIDRIRTAPITPVENLPTPDGRQQRAPSPSAEASRRPGDIEVVFTDRSRLVGQWLPARGALLRLDSSVVDSPAHIVEFPPQQVRGIIGHRARYQNALAFHKNGTLRIDDWELSGYLEENSPEGSTTALHWRPHCSRNAAEIGPDLSGVIQYRKPLPEVRIEPSQDRQPGRVELPRRIQILLERRASPSQRPTGEDGYREQDRSGSGAGTSDLLEITFRSGDAIDGRIERIDAQGVHFVSPQTATRFAPHAQLQSAQIHAGVENTSIDQEKLRRLTTVPRADRDDPPTHLLIATGGDFLRGRLIGYDGHRLQMDVRGHVHAIAAERVAKIIWLHDRDWTSPPKSAAGSPPPTGENHPGPFQIHAINRQGRGLTFQPVRTVDNVLEGRSDLLGEVQLRLDDIDQLLFGRNVADRVRRFRKNPWALSLARLPRDFDPQRRNGAGGGDRLGQPAPDFVAATTDGKSFRLSSSRGRVVLLQFWASWSAPCTESLPATVRLVRELENPSLDLVLVNVQESAQRARLALEKLDLPVPSALDTDGDIAAAYAVTSIPHTVLVDASGVVQHVSVGLAPDTIATLRAAVQRCAGR